jgi:tetratricopeptide (TPR) repeat protein
MRIKELTGLFICCLLGLLLTACASSTPKEDEAAKQAQAERKEKTKVYFSGMTAQKVTAVTESCSNVNQSSKKLSWTELVGKANGCVKAANWSAVEAWAFEISRNNIESPWGLYYYSVAAEAKQDYPRAMWMIQAAMKKSAADVALFRYQKGRVLWEMNPCEAALTEIETALKFDPTLVAAHDFLGDARLRVADYKRAEQHFAAALKLDPTDGPAQKGLALVAMQTGSRSVAQVSSPSSNEVKKQGVEK